MKLLNFINLFFGLLLIIGGVLKCFGGFEKFELHLGTTYLIISNSTSFFYIILINFAGGASMFYHAFSTLRFKKKMMNIPDLNLLDDAEFETEIKNMSNISILTCFVTLLVSFWLFIRTIIILSSLIGNIHEYWPLMSLTIVIYGFFSFIPILLSVKNLTLYNEINKISDMQKKARIREKYKDIERR